MYGIVTVATGAELTSVEIGVTVGFPSNKVCVVVVFALKRWFREAVPFCSLLCKSQTS